MDEDDVGSKKRKNKPKRGREWEMTRSFQLGWLSKYPFMVPVGIGNANDTGKVTLAKCNICSWKCGRAKMLQLKIDTIEKHIGKVYEKQIIDEKEKPIVRWKSKEECLHVRYVAYYQKHE